MVFAFFSTPTKNQEREREGLVFKSGHEKGEARGTESNLTNKREYWKPNALQYHHDMNTFCCNHK